VAGGVSQALKVVLALFLAVVQMFESLIFRFTSEEKLVHITSQPILLVRT
jgi:hypothetical protein